ncbi:xylose dehydrogenase (NAD/NADP) [Halogeometricum limi]|uniref:Xylose dehydrogenase (NAD/NADP) n=2 Tax=Halogeometricum limi TaxID=555875 RepID=A0A1I6IDE3_9EURY|nr:xylose dehydrogenase (NAD/NADP) [Halogeometricum limi]
MDAWYDEWRDRYPVASADDPVRFAVVGLGGFAREYALPAIESADGCEATVAVSGSPETAANVVAAHGMDRHLTYEAYADGVGTADYDAVYVATPHARHAEHVETAARHGKAVLCEKALAATTDGAERIVEAVESAGVPFAVAYRMQFAPAVCYARHLVATGFVGEPAHVHADFSVRMLADPATPNDAWRLDPDLAGGSALVDLGLYPLNTTRFVLDDDPVRVRGETSSPHAAFDAVDEHVAFTMRFESGAHAVCTASQHAHESHHLRVVGSEGAVTLEPVFFEGAPQTVRLERGGRTTTVELGPVEQLPRQFAAFAGSVSRGIDPEPGVREGLRDTRLLAAIYDSAADGVAVDV